ncbi:MAG: retropepsin-like aspartic protease [Thermodesulfovibrionales bacterium]
MFLRSTKWNTIEKYLIAIISFFLISPAYAEDYIYTNKDLEKYKSSSKKIEATEKVKNKSKSKKKSDKPPRKAEPAVKKKEEKKPVQYEVPYVSQEGSSKRIIISVTFNDSVKALMLLDTGAPGMYISHGLAEKLGIFDKGEGLLQIEAGGIGGKIPAVLTVVDTVQVGGVKEIFVPTTIGNSLSGIYEGLIGMNFMSGYSIRIDTNKHVVVFEEIPAAPDMPGGHDEEWWRTNYRQFSSAKKEWEEFKAHVYNMKDENNKLKKVKEFADKQVKEAEKLTRKLDSFAIDHAVPMSWREY